MKESVLDVLMYLFGHYLDEDAEIESDEESLKWELIAAGFPEREIAKAFSWLEGLVPNPSEAAAQVVHSPAAMRVFTPQEVERLDLECRRFLLYLEQAGVLDAVTREFVIERVMALETDAIDLAQLKWVVLMVLFNQPGGQAAYSWVEDLVLDRGATVLH
jgi:Smg protein